MENAAERRFGKGEGEVRPGGMRGGTEPPVGSSGRDFFGSFIPTQLSPRGAGRIQSLRAFRQAYH